MNIVKTGTVYRLFDKSVETGDRLPAQAYTLGFNKFDGMFLKEAEMPTLRDEKVYGDHDFKLDKVMKSYSSDASRNLGVILSGEKGIGKTLFAKMAAVRAVKEGMPVIFVNHCIPGIPDFFAKITQNCCVVFDEFDKNFCSNDSTDVDRTAVQDTLLTMFDGIYGGHKLFVITCNELAKLSDFYVNRPGRFRYHIRFDYPNADEVRGYLTDKCGKDKSDDIESVVRFSAMVPLSYDCLSAIASELIAGESFKSAMQMLNIIRIDEDQEYTIDFIGDIGEVNGWKHNIAYGQELDLFSPEKDESQFNYGVSYYDEETSNRLRIGSVFFRLGDLRKHGKFDRNGRIVLGKEFFTFVPYECSDKRYARAVELGKKVVPDHLEISQYSYVRRNVSYASVL